MLEVVERVTVAFYKAIRPRVDLVTDRLNDVALTDN